MKITHASKEEVLSWVDQISTDLAGLKTLLPELFDRAKYGTNDGYPTTSRLGSVSSGDKTSPVERVALANVEAQNDTAKLRGRDPVLFAKHSVINSLYEIKRLAESTLNQTTNNLQVPEVPDPEELEIERRCECGTKITVARNNQCEACYRYEKRTGRKRPISLARKAG